jgi:hypothetical protein
MAPMPVTTTRFIFLTLDEGIWMLDFFERAKVKLRLQTPLATLSEKAKGSKRVCFEPFCQQIPGLGASERVSN